MNDTHPTARDQAGRRATIMTVIAGLTVVVAVAMWLFGQGNGTSPQGQILNPQAMAQPPLNDRLVTENSGTNDVLGLLAGPKSVGQLMMTSSQDRLMLQEPADLPAYPGGRRDAGLRRQSGGIVEETVFWNHAKASMKDLESFYDKAATDAGFRPCSPRDSADSATINRLYVRHPHDRPADDKKPSSPNQASLRIAGQSEVLMLRLWPSPDGGTQWMLWLRYPQAE